VSTCRFSPSLSALHSLVTMRIIGSSSTKMMFDKKKKRKNESLRCTWDVQLNSDERRLAASSSACQIEYQLPVCKFSLSRRCVMCKSSENGSNRKKKTVAILVEKKETRRDRSSRARKGKLSTC
jgi:hypothetical protein